MYSAKQQQQQQQEDTNALATTTESDIFSFSVVTSDLVVKILSLNASHKLLNEYFTESSRIACNGQK